MKQKFIKLKNGSVIMFPDKKDKMSLKGQHYDRWYLEEPEDKPNEKP